MVISGKSVKVIMMFFFLLDFNWNKVYKFDCMDKFKLCIIFFYFII